MSPNSERTQPFFNSRASFLRGPAAILGLLFVLMLLLVAMPAGHAGAQPDYLQLDTLVASNYDVITGAYLGEAVAVSGDTIVVGAPGENSGTGAVYIYVRPADGWTTSAMKLETAKLVPSVLTTDDRFGSSVAISGDTIVVGAPGDDGDAGAAYVFVRPDGGWASLDADVNARLTPADEVNVWERGINDLFGVSVAISGDTIVVGVPASQKGDKAGAAFVFTRPLTGWVAASSSIRLSDTNSAPDDDFGLSVATDGDTVIVGAQSDDSGADKKTDEGSAFVFVKPDGAWAADNTPDTQLTASEGAPGDHFGVSVAIHEEGDAVVVGAENATPPVPAVDAVKNGTQGAAYVFMKPESGWAAASTEDAILSTAAGSASDKFGHSVAISGDTIVVGAYNYVITAGQEGAAFVYVQPIPSAKDPSMYADWVTTDTPDATLSAGASAQAGDQFGESVAVFGGTIVSGVPFDTIEAAGNAANGVDVPLPSSQGSAVVYMNGYCSAKSGLWHDGTTWVGGGVPINTADVCISTGHVVEMDAVPVVNGISVDVPIPVVRRLLVNPGATLELQGFDLEVNEEVTNNGTLQQVKSQNTFGYAEILLIQQEGAASSVYRGVGVDSGFDLGAVTVVLRETVDWFSPTSQYNYCTSQGAGSAPYIQRCFSISPAAPALSSITLWSLKDELNGVAVKDLAVYHFNGSEFVKLEPVENSELGGFIGYEYAKGPTSEFSAFLIGDQALGPTAVSMIALSGGAAGGVPALMLAGAALLVLLSLGLLVHLRRQRV